MDRSVFKILISNSGAFPFRFHLSHRNPPVRWRGKLKNPAPALTLKPERSGPLPTLALNLSLLLYPYAPCARPSPSCPSRPLLLGSASIPLPRRTSLTPVELRIQVTKCRPSHNRCSIDHGNGFAQVAGKV